MSCQRRCWAEPRSSNNWRSLRPSFHPSVRPDADLTVFGRRGRVALPPVLPLPLVSLLLAPLALPAWGGESRRQDDCNTQIPQSRAGAGRPAGRSRFLTSCVFCVPWLAARPPAPGNETRWPGVSGTKEGRFSFSFFLSVFFLCFLFWFFFRKRLIRR